MRKIEYFFTNSIFPTQKSITLSPISIQNDACQLKTKNYQKFVKS